MTTRETITRRSRGTRLSTPDLSTESGEKESSSNGFSKPASPNGRLRRRQKETKLELSMRTLQRKWMLAIRQNPLTKLVYATLALGLLVFLSSRTAKTSAGRAFSNDFDVSFKKDATSSTELYEPEDLDPYDEDFYSDYGGLEMNWLEEDGAVRTILYDSSYSKTAYRDRDRSPDDDVDM